MKRRERESEVHNSFSAKKAENNYLQETWHSSCSGISNSECYPLGIPLQTKHLVAEFVEGCHFLLHHVEVVHIFTCPGRQYIEGSTGAVSC